MEYSKLKTLQEMWSNTLMKNVKACFFSFSFFLFFLRNPRLMKKKKSLKLVYLINEFKGILKESWHKTWFKDTSCMNHFEYYNIPRLTKLPFEFSNKG